MSVTNVVDLSFAPGEQQDLAGLPYDVGMLNGGDAEEVRELNISHAHLVGLTSAPETPISDLLQFVTVLHASHNDISSLRGLEAFVSLEVLDLSFNCLRVVDAHATNLLKTLRRLRAIDFSHNHMNLLDLDGSYGAPSPRSAGPSGGVGLLTSSAATAGDAANGLAFLSSINLSHNAFIEVPDLRSAPFLQVLNISNNKLETVADLDVRLPLLSLHSLLLHTNSLPSVSALVPLCALATTLKHIQVFGNPFTYVSGRAAEGVDVTLWWRPFLLFLCPLLVTADQTEFTSSERRVASRRLFREHGSLSRNLMEYMNPQSKDALEAYLKRQSEAAEPPADALIVIKELGDEDDDVVMPQSGNGRAAMRNAMEQAGDSADNDEHMADVIVPMSCTNAVREQGALESSGTHTRGPPLMYYIDSPEGFSSPTGVATTNALSSRSSTRVVIVDPSSKTLSSPQHHSASPKDGIFLTNHNHQRTKTVPLATVVRALQQKTRSLEEVVAVLWRGDLARRTMAAVVIQRYMRGALVRMHLSEDDAESCRFIRYQLQQAAAAMKAQNTLSATNAGGSAVTASISRGRSARAAGAPGARQPSMEAIEAGGSNIEDILISMRSLQEVMSNMWLDLEEYRAMADREQRRAAVLIQRWYRGYRVRRDVGRVRHGGNSPSSSPATVSPACKCAGKTAALQKEVTELRHEVRELRELLVQSARAQRLAAYDDPEKAADDIIRKHEARVSADRNREKNSCGHGHSRSPSATPSITVADTGASEERGLYCSTPRGDSRPNPVSRDEVMEAVSESPSQSKVHLHRMPQDLSARISPSGATSPTNTSPSTHARGLAKITKRRPGDGPLPSHPTSPSESAAAGENE
jgi:hypothetical protein